MNPVITDIQNKISENVRDSYEMISKPAPETHYNVTAICSVGQIKVNNFCGKLKFILLQAPINI